MAPPAAKLLPGSLHSGCTAPWDFCRGPPQPPGPPRRNAGPLSAGRAGGAHSHFLGHVRLPELLLHHGGGGGGPGGGPSAPARLHAAAQSRPTRRRRRRAAGARLGSSRRGLPGPPRPPAAAAPPPGRCSRPPLGLTLGALGAHRRSLARHGTVTGQQPPLPQLPGAAPPSALGGSAFSCPHGSPGPDPGHQRRGGLLEPTLRQHRYKRGSSPRLATQPPTGLRRPRSQPSRAHQARISHPCRLLLGPALERTPPRRGSARARRTPAPPYDWLRAGPSSFSRSLAGRPPPRW